MCIYIYFISKNHVSLYCLRRLFSKIKRNMSTFYCNSWHFIDTQFCHSKDVHYYRVSPVWAFFPLIIFMGRYFPCFLVHCTNKYRFLCCELTFRGWCDNHFFSFQNSVDAVCCIFCLLCSSKHLKNSIMKDVYISQPI